MPPDSTGGDWNIYASDANHVVFSQVPASNHDARAPRDVSGSTFTAKLQCGGPGTCRGNGNAHFTIDNTDVALTDEHPPESGTPTGALAGAKISGVAPVTFRATDVGGGVRFVHIYDNGVDHITLIDPNNDNCADVTGSGAHDYPRRVPCLLSATATAALDTTTLADGNHTIKVTLEDAAGNTATVLRARDEARRQPPAGQHGAPAHRQDGAELRLLRGAARRPADHVLVGRLLDGSGSGPRSRLVPLRRRAATTATRSRGRTS